MKMLRITKGVTLVSQTLPYYTDLTDFYYKLKYETPMFQRFITAYSITLISSMGLSMRFIFSKINFFLRHC